MQGHRHEENAGRTCHEAKQLPAEPRGDPIACAAIRTGNGPHSSETVGVLSIGGRIVSHAALQDDAPKPAAEDPALPQPQEPSERKEEPQVLARAPLHAPMSAFGRGSR